MHAARLAALRAFHVPIRNGSERRSTGGLEDAASEDHYAHGRGEAARGRRLLAPAIPFQVLMVIVKDFERNCPPKVKDGDWQAELHHTRLPRAVGSAAQLVRHRALMGPMAGLDECWSLDGPQGQ